MQDPGRNGRARFCRSVHEGRPIMKRAALLFAAVVVAVPLAASGEEAPPKKTSDTAKTASPQPGDVPKVLQTASPAPESALVAAAKKTKRSGKKVVVITNETLSTEATSS